MNIKRIVLLLPLVTILMDYHTVRGMNLLQAYDTLVWPDYDNKSCWQLSFFAEKGFGVEGFNEDGAKVDPLRIWNCDQDGLAMLEGFPSGSLIDQKRIQINADDDGVRGHFTVSGKLDLEFTGAFFPRYFFLPNWSVSAYLPFYAVRLHDVRWIDKTLSITDQDLRVKTLLTDNFDANVQALGCLNLRGWRRTGIGDLVAFIEWFRDFPQSKPLLENVRVNWRIGLNFPTGLKHDDDKVFALPFGTDGAFGVPFALGLDLYCRFHVKMGVDVELLPLFGNTRTRRIKTDVTQTDLLLLQEAEVYRDFGLTQRFNLYFQLYRIFKGFSFKLGYELLKHEEDDIAVSGNCFSNEIANTAESLKEWTLHQIVLQANYDFGCHLTDWAWVRPQLALFTRLPFNGKRSVGFSTFGLSLSFDF